MKKSNCTGTLLAIAVVALALFGLTATSDAATVLKVDFNSTNQDGGPHNQAGWSAYDAGHEVAGDFVTQTYGGITVTPDWTNTTDNRVRQMIDRTAGWDVNWDNSAGDLDLVTDIIGTDTRTTSGGNGDWDGITGTPTYMTVALGGLDAGDYEWTSFHHDVEKVWGPFAAWLSTDGGATFTQLPDGLVTNSGPGSVPASQALEYGPDVYTLPSTYTTSFNANGTDDVVMRFAPYSGDGVHRQIWGMNGFVLELGKANTPDPADGAQNVAVDIDLSWNTGSGVDVANHVLYLSAANDPNLTTVTPVTIAADGSGSASYTPAADLDRDAVYTWRVDQKLTDASVVTGSVWSFESVPSTPVILTQPVVDTLADAGAAVDLVIEALNPFTSDATGLEYQWSHDGTPAGTDATLSIPSAQIADEGEYYCVVTITSNSATTDSDSGWVNVKRTVQYHSFDGDLTDTVGVNDGVYTNVDPNLVTPTFDTGFAGQAILLNGQEYINIGTAGYPRAKSSLEHGSVACWIKTTVGGKIIGNFNDLPGNYTTGFEFEVNSSGNLRAYVRDEAGDTAIQRISGTANDDAWHFAVAAWNASPEGGELSLYLDGASLGTTTAGGVFETFGDWLYDVVIGARNNRGTADGFFTGLIDEVKVYNYTLTADDVAVAYEGYTGLDTCVHPPALDFTGPGPDDSDEDGVFDKDCVVDMYDFAYFASSWLECGLVPECL